MHLVELLRPERRDQLRDLAHLLALPEHPILQRRHLLLRDDPLLDRHREVVQLVVQVPWDVQINLEDVARAVALARRQVPHHRAGGGDPDLRLDVLLGQADRINLLLRKPLEPLVRHRERLGHGVQVVRVQVLDVAGRLLGIVGVEVLVVGGGVTVPDVADPASDHLLEEEVLLEAALTVQQLDAEARDLLARVFEHTRPTVARERDEALVEGVNTPGVEGGGSELDQHIGRQADVEHEIQVVILPQ